MLNKRVMLSLLQLYMSKPGKVLEGSSDRLVGSNGGEWRIANES
jgi:hypothetical protein